ncbi:hypothetical protein [Flavobacterium cerinum]|uniref:Lipocalin-like domain-containing protein n=1 Tax=Flavobacterium cerinum TaxID=2502784 RepID=A0ABY5IQK7_9FLAO|nr:hypothetical protein [Flavobacterium cerinum]UUC44576.1 hypothetical protein NOX80_13150 [Flavobacterium cerinum]
MISLSCKKESQLEDMLTSETKKWCLYLDDYEPGLPLLAYTIFHKNGSHELYYRVQNKETPVKKGKWYYSEKDSTLNWNGVNLKVQSIEQDTIFLKVKEHNILLINRK